MNRNAAAAFALRDGADGADGGATDKVLRLTLSVSSETPVLRQDGWTDPWLEILGHTPEEVDLSRMTGGSVLANHNRWGPSSGDTPLAMIGAIERAWLQDGRLHADISISRREGLSGLRQDILDGLVTNVSIGYIIDERILTKTDGGKSPDEYRVTRWTPFEVSLVDVPADPSVGLDRSLTRQPPGNYRIIPIDPPPAEGTTRSQSMPTEMTAPAAADPIDLERARVREITAVGRQWNVPELADAAIEAGTDADVFASRVLQQLKDTGRLRPAESPEIGMTAREAENFSFCRAILAAGDPLHAAQIAPFEMECSRAAQDKRGDSRDKSREAALTIPVDVLMRGIQINAAQSTQIMSRLFARARQSPIAAGIVGQRDLTVGVPTGGGNLVATQLLGADFISLLRNAMVLDQLGCTFLRDLTGNIAIPSHTGAATGYWVAENGAPTESAPATGQLAASPKTVGAFVDYSRRLLLQSSIDVEAFVRADLAAVIGLMIQIAAFNGAGASNEPLGLLNTSGIGSVAGGTNGATPTYANMVDLETAVATANGDVGNLAFLSNAKVRGWLRKTQEFSGTNGKAVWSSQPGSRGIGDVLGYDAFCTNSMPSNLVKGTSGAVCSAIAFGNWSDLMIFMWGGLDLLLDPYTGSTTGAKRVVALQDVDIGIRHAGSFAVMKDALTV